MDTKRGPRRGLLLTSASARMTTVVWYHCLRAAETMTSVLAHVYVFSSHFAPPFSWSGVQHLYIDPENLLFKVYVAACLNRGLNWAAWKQLHTSEHAFTSCYDSLLSSHPGRDGWFFRCRLSNKSKGHHYNYDGFFLSIQPPQQNP